MFRKISYSSMMLAFSVAPAFASSGGSQDGVGSLLIQAVTKTAGKLLNLLLG